MLWKLILTLAVIIGAYLVIRVRMSRAQRLDAQIHESPGWSPRVARVAAYGILGLLLGGTGLYLARHWDQGREILRVQVVNANTGAVTDYRARRRDIEGRGFRTIEGQVIRLAEVERMVLTAADREP